jgi:hypothetical protein
MNAGDMKKRGMVMQQFDLYSPYTLFMVIRIIFNTFARICFGRVIFYRYYMIGRQVDFIFNKKKEWK